MIYLNKCMPLVPKNYEGEKVTTEKRNTQRVFVCVLSTEKSWFVK